MHSHKALLFVAPLEHREVDYPEACELVLVAQAKAVAHFETQFAELLARLHGIVATENENEVALLGAEGLLHLLERFLSVEFVDRRLDCSVGLDAGVDHPLGADLRTLHELSELINLLAGIVCSPLGADAANICGVVEHTET